MFAKFCLKLHQQSVYGERGIRFYRGIVMSESEKIGDQEVQMDRRREERRADETAVDANVESKPRRKQQRRRQIDPTTCERDYNQEELRFMRALDDYKRSSGRMFPTCSEILEVIRDMGYILLNEEEKQLLDSVREVEEELSEATDSDNSEDEEDELETLEADTY